MIYPTKTWSGGCGKSIANLMDTDFNPFVEDIKRSFFSHPSYLTVYKNFDYSQGYDAWVEEGSAPNKSLPYKSLASYPYPEPVFEIGDYISFKYGNTPNSMWIIQSLDSQVYYNVIGRMLKINQVAKFQLAGNPLREFYVSFQDQLNYTNFKYDRSGVTTPSGMAVLITQQNETTKYLRKNHRLMFNGIAFRIQQILSQVNEKLLELYLTEDSLLAQDDIENNIAWNDDVITPTTDETIIAPGVYSILQGESQSYTVYKYINGKTAPDTFTMTCDGVPTANYTFVATSNGFVITNLKRATTMLNVTCTNNKDKTTVSISIMLNGEY